MATIKGKTKVWLSRHSYVTPKQIEEGTAKVSAFYFSDTDLTGEGYTLVGEAEIVIAAVDAKTLIDNKVHALREEAKSIRAEATMKCTQIEDKIQKLLAISYDSNVTVQA